MATQGLVTVKSGDKVLMKIVAGCDGNNAQKLADSLKAVWPVDIEYAFKEALENGFGSLDCLVVMTESEVKFNGDEDLSDLYRETFNQPKFNPRWEYGTSDYTVVIDVA